MRKDILIKKLNEIVKEYEKDEFADLYDFEIREQDGTVYVIDKTEESYDNRWMLRKFDEFLKANGMFLECDCPGRYIVVR